MYIVKNYVADAAVAETCCIQRTMKIAKGHSLQTAHSHNKHICQQDNCGYQTLPGPVLPQVPLVSQFENTSSSRRLFLPLIANMTSSTKPEV